jgi:hypothetical protein
MHGLIVIVRGGQAHFFLKFANRKSTNSWASSAIANPQISYVHAGPHIANLQIL